MFAAAALLLVFYRSNDGLLPGKRSSFPVRVEGQQRGSSGETNNPGVPEQTGATLRGRGWGGGVGIDVGVGGTTAKMGAEREEGAPQAHAVGHQGDLSAVIHGGGGEGRGDAAAAAARKEEENNGKVTEAEEIAAGVVAVENPKKVGGSRMFFYYFHSSR